MRYLKLAAVVLIVACNTTKPSNDKTLTGPPAEIPFSNGDAIVVMNSTGERIVGGFTPRSAPYGEHDGPSVIAWLPGQGGTAENGRAVPGVKFIGWNDGDWTHVRAFALVAKPGATDLHNEKTLESRPLGEYVMHRAESAPVAEMSRFGVTPFIVKLQRGSS